MRRAVIDKANPRQFPRFVKDPKPYCAVHNCEMSKRTEQAPMFEAVGAYPKRQTRTVWYCAVANCHRVQHGDTHIEKSSLNQRYKDEGWLSLL